MPLSAAQVAAISHAESLGEKRLSTALANIPKLVDIGYEKFNAHILRTAFVHDWHGSILDLDIDEPEDDEDTPKYRVDQKNAYSILLQKVEGHQVANLLDPPTVQMGDARAAYASCHEFFHRSTHAGKGQATLAFYGATMANTDTNIVEWIALVPKRGRLLIRAGGMADNGSNLTILLGGLLDEFKPIKTILNADKAVDMAAATAQLIDYATTNDLLTTSKTSKVSGRASTFSVNNQKTKKAKTTHQSAGGASTATPASTSYTPPPKTYDDDGKECCRNFKMDRGCKFDPCKYSHKPKASDKAPSYSTASVNVHDAKSVRWTDTDDDYDTYKSSSYSLGAIAGLPPGQTVDSLGGEESPTISNTMWTALLLLLSCITTIVMLPWSTVVSAASTASTSLDSLKPWSGVSISPWYAFDASPGKCAVTMLLIMVLFLKPARSEHICAATVSSSAFLAGGGSSGVTPNFEWCSDTGTNRFVTNDDSDFIPNSVVQVQTNVAVGGGNTTSHKTGTVIIRSLDHKHIIHCKDVLYLPNCGTKLMPASQFIRMGCILTYRDNQVTLKNPKGAPMLSGKEIDGLYYFHSSTVHNAKLEKCKTTKAEVDSASSTFFGLQAGTNISDSAQDFSSRLLEAHWSYGHIHFDKLRKLLGLKKGNNPDCAACTLAKSRQEALSDHAYVRSTQPNHRMHMDIGFTRNSKYCFQLCIDDYTRVGYLDILPCKDEALAKWIELKNHLETLNFPSKFAIVKSDSEPLYCTPAWKAHATECHLVHEYSSRHRHDQMGVVERAMQVVGTSFRCIMFQGSAPECDSGDCLKFANVIRNNSPTTANNGWTPNEKAAGMKLPVNRRLLRGPMFCLVFAHVYEQERAKHAPRGVASVYLGYDPVNNAYLVKEWVSGQRYYTADVTFHPTTFPYRANPNRSIGSLNQYDEYAPHLTVHLEQEPGTRRTKATRVRAISSRALENLPDQDVPPDAPPAPAAPDQVHFVHSFGPDPDTLAEAHQMHDADDWIAAELTERNSLKQHNVKEAIPRSEVPQGKRIFKPRPVLKRKINPPDAENPTGSIEKHKVRMTIAAFTKMLKQGIDYEEKHAATVRWNSIKILVAIAVQFDFDIFLIDIKTFFLYGKLPKGSEMFMEIPAGWEDSEEEVKGDYVWKLLGTLYGMPQAPHEAQKVLREVMGAGDKFKASTADDCVYVTKDHSTGYCASGTHVDDTMAIGDPKGVKKLIVTLEKKFELTIKKNPSIITGVEIERNREKKWCKLHQGSYTTELLTKYQMLNSHLSRPVDTPMDGGTAKILMLLPTDSATPASIKLYQNIVGGLMWLMRTRTDMFFTINLLARFLKCATPQHVAIAKGRPMRYLSGTITHGLVFMPGDGTWALSGVSDADLAGDLNTARSTSGHTTQLGQFGCISSSSTLERKISNSTGMSETYAHMGLAKEIIWDRHILRELGFPQADATPALTDNEGVKNQSTKAINHAGAKHYRIAQAMIRQLNFDSVMKTTYVNTDSNPADFLTKALGGAAFARHRLSTMGPQKCPQ